ncbi:membrane protein [Streptomyces virginiae]|uniref:Membrane protein n=2 Tax=Streptomyces virginiae TaxID=1961 RepID=A0ABQ3NDW0_STRVG|nr:FtsX-like permease family protein [Streptomyces virginiae]MBP2346231.1 ABC-type antimicrobial peptide transport system permease subunit [Streptomyces virginiae]GGQ41948.1 membrane protein [Streptomyces virginiae]GHI10917.1 membrane protein [Streptomyces virginiae]
MSRLQVWTRDLAMGARFAFGGGREGWIRTLLTGVGVGLGVALLLISTAIPGALTARYERGDARSTMHSDTADAPGPDTLLIARIGQTYHHKDIEGHMVRAEGPNAPLPPGLKKIPGPGEMALSPALDELLKSSEGALLRERLDARVSEVVGDPGLVGPGELLFYLGSDTLRKNGPEDYRVERVTSFGYEADRETLDPVLMLMVVLTFVALLMPVAVFIATAVRFGGDRRDRRLAALRLVGADSRMVRRIAAGEALAGSLVGLVLGTGFFAVGRSLVGSVSLQQRSVFPADLDPAPWLAVLVALAVPAAAVAVTLFALRGVVIEPLGVVRTARPSRRRIWWRLLLPLVGLGLLVPLDGRGNSHGRFNQWQVSAGVVLLLVGITVLLPWLLERFVGKMSGGPVSWQLAVRRLQVNSGSAARLVNGIAVAVAGAIALQMLFAGVEGDYTKSTGQDPGRAAVAVMVNRDSDAPMDELARRIAAVQGVTRAVPLTSTQAAHRMPAEEDTVQVTVGTCDALGEVATLDSCEEGDAFVLTGPSSTGFYGGTAKPGDELFVGNVRQYEFETTDSPAPVKWRVPAGARTVPAREDPTGQLRSGLLVTPSAAPKELGDFPDARIFVQVDESGPDALDRARNAVFRTDPFVTAMTLRDSTQAAGFSSIRTGLFFGAAAVLVLTGASLFVSQLEQLRERRRLLSSLVAFGTKRSTLSLSVLWQTAVPIVLGLVLAAFVGTALGAVLMGMAAQPVRIDWPSVLGMTGVGAGVVAAVTLLSLPPLLRLMRPDGLRTE